MKVLQRFLNNGLGCSSNKMLWPSAAVVVAVVVVVVVAAVVVVVVVVVVVASAVSFISAKTRLVVIVAVFGRKIKN